ncbi:MAG: fucose pyrophosphorylase domain-containing protein, partial [Planctomycetota bacterium]
MEKWDYLIVTASNIEQAQAYEMQLCLRQQLGFLECVREVLVVPDPGGKRIGSGGSTICCLLEILNRELAIKTTNISDPQLWHDILRQLRILIIHAGGDSKRLPTYGPCGKLFVPMPGENDCCLPLTLFDRQLPTYLNLPAPPSDFGQVVITAGDVLLWFDPYKVQFAEKGLTGLGCYASGEQAEMHGVFCRDETDQVRLFLQKPSLAEQQKMGVVNPYGQAILDIGVMNFDADTAVMLLQTFDARSGPDGKLQLTGKMGNALLKYGLDFYREICCGIGSEASLARYISSVQQSGSPWSKALLGQLLESLSSIPFYVKVLPQCEFLHFGTSQQIISSGNVLMQKDLGSTSPNTCLCINNEITDDGRVVGTNAWVEGCRINSML